MAKSGLIDSIGSTQMAAQRALKRLPAATTLGQHLRSLRLRQALDQKTVASRAGVALNAVKKLESGKNSTVRSLLLILRVLGREDWLSALAPQVSISPLDLLKLKKPRQRAPRRNPANRRRSSDRVDADK